MSLSPQELRARASAFAAEWAHARRETAEAKPFWVAFFGIFGVAPRRVATWFEQAATKLSGNTGFIDLFWPGTLLIEHKSRGADLFRARGQALDYLHGLPDTDLPRFVLTCDFRDWNLTDLDTGETLAFALPDLPKHIDRFAFVLGRTVRKFKDQDPVNIRAAELVGDLHDAIERSGYRGHPLEVFLTRIVFCLFADDTGIFEPRDRMWDLLAALPGDGSQTGAWLAGLFDVLNTPESARQSTLGDDLRGFPYVNGHLFAEYFAPPRFDAAMHAALLNACRFDWTPISPAIFGSLFQSVMNPAERRALGAHYTTESNILKLIGPLFLDDLRAEFEAAQARRSGGAAALRALLDRLAGLTFFDPACGCGNFLVVTYREIRALELDILRALHRDGQLALDARSLSRVDVDQFFGIEVEEFPARIAETALWMMDHLANLALSAAFGAYYPRIPLKKSPTIRHADALETDWATVLPPERCSYVLGNPPFVGAKFQSDAQRAQVRRIANLGGSGGTLDFVAAWFLKAGEYVGRGGGVNPALPDGPGRAGFTPPQTRIAFVATNSITQGEQVAQLWPLLFDRYGLEIAFAHRTFAWGSEARGAAHVHVVIIGLDRRANARADKRLFSYAHPKADPVESRHAALSPYLFDASGLTNPHLVVKEESRPINGMPVLKTGVQMIDNGILTFTDEQKRAFVVTEADSEQFFRKYIGGDEFINGYHRWILYLREAAPAELRRLPSVAARVAQVRAYRLASDRPSTQRMADYPTLVGVDERLDAPYLVIPNTSSERRDYVPIGWLGPDVIANQKLRILPNASLSDFAVLTSAMHMAWMRAITGRMKSDYMYSVGVVYNTFPLPPGADLSGLDPLAQAVLDARAAHPGASLADLYDPDLMPPDLRAAHGRLDRAVDRLYRRQPFGSDRERVEHLFALYERQSAPLLPTLPKPQRGRRKGE